MISIARVLARAIAEEMDLQGSPGNYVSCSRTECQWTQACGQPNGCQGRNKRLVERAINRQFRLVFSADAAEAE